MARILFVLACDSISYTNDDKMIIRDPLHSYAVPFLPTQLSFNIVGGIDNLDATVKYPITFKIISPTGVVVFEEGGSFQYENPNQEYPNTQFAVQVKNRVFNEEGEHRIEVNIDNQAPFTQYFRVIKEK